MTKNKKFINAVLVMLFLFLAVIGGTGCGGPSGVISNDDGEEYTEPSPTPNTSFTVTFDSNGGSAVPSQSVVSGSTATMPDAPILSNYIFCGWYSDNDTFENMFLFGDGGDVINEDVTLYAQWIENNPNALAVAYVINDVEIGYSEGDYPRHITDDLILPTNVDGFDDTTVTWSSSNSSVIATDGKVTRPSGFDANVTLTVTASRGDSSESREYQLKVIHSHT